MTVPQQRRLGDRYALSRTIGIGGMSEVFLGTDTRLGREVAVKVLRADLARDPTFLSRFRREAQSAASLNAPCIVAVYDSGEDVVEGSPSVPWIVMEHVQGRTLRDVLNEEGPLPAPQALRIGADVCAALQVAHEAGIVHRDVKPGNVMLTGAGEVKVMDFGIARAAAGGTQTMTQTAAVFGTAAYLSPEQALGAEVDARSDVYSTGCLVYELLTGRPPFTGDSPVAVAYQHVQEPPVPPSTWRPDLSPAVDAVVVQALAKDPAARYPSAEALRQDLLRAATGAPVEAAPPPVAAGPVPTGSVPLRGTRQRLRYAVLALLLAAAVALAVVVPAALDDPVADVTAPSLVGLPQTDARSRLLELGLEEGTLSYRFSDAPVGDIVGQAPPAGLPVAVGTRVDLVVSRGREETLVPEVVGQSQREAEAQLEQAQLRVRDVLERDDNVPPGQVLEVIPESGTRVPVDDEVTLVVSSGRVEVPLVVGQTRRAAEQRLQRSGFSVTVRLQPDAGPAGRVLSQDPANSSARRGSTVTLVVSRTPRPAATTVAPAPTRTSASPRPTTSSPSPSASPSPSPSPSASPSASPSPSRTSASPTPSPSASPSPSPR